MKKIILLFAGFFICLYFIWVRLILIYVPTDISFETNLFKFILYGYFFLLFLYLFLKQLYPGKSSNIILKVIKEKLIDKFIKIYNQSLTQLLIFFFEESRFSFFEKISYKSFYFISTISTASFFTKFNTFLFFLIIKRVPQLIVAIFFVADIIYFQKFFYFYKFLWILIIPLFWRAFVGIIEHMSSFYTKNISRHFEITIKYNDPKVTKYKQGGVGVYMKRKYPNAADVPEEAYALMKQFYWHIFCIDHYFIPTFSERGLPSRHLVSKILYGTYLFLYLLGFGYLAFRYGLGI